MFPVMHVRSSALEVSRIPLLRVNSSGRSRQIRGEQEAGGVQQASSKREEYKRKQEVSL
jgi:hypothetical protein